MIFQVCLPARGKYQLCIIDCKWISLLEKGNGIQENLDITDNPRWVKSGKNGRYMGAVVAEYWVMYQCHSGDFYLFRTAYKKASHRIANTCECYSLLDIVVRTHCLVHSHNTWGQYCV